MDPTRGNRDILVANKDLSSVQYYQTSNQARPMPSKGSKKPVQDDINKLFEAINIRSSKSLDLSDHSSAGLSRKNASKRPMRVVPSYASGIGFSEPVSLKQALRGLCISQAGEMAAKRLLRSPGSPRILDSARNSSMHRSIVVETVESGIPLTEGREGMFEITLVPEECPSGSLASKQGNLKEPKALLANQKFHSSTDWVVKPDMKSVKSSLERKVIPSESSKVPTHSFGAGHCEQVSGECKIKSLHYISEPKDSSQHHIVPAPLEVDVQSLGTTATQKGKQTLNSVLRDRSISPSSPNQKVGTSTKVASKSNPKLRRKAKLPIVSSSISLKISKERKSIRNTSRAVKPPIRSKNLLLKKQKQEQVITGSNSKSSEAIDSSGYNSNQLVCHKCHCHLKDIKKEPDKDFMAPFNNTKAGAVAILDSRTFDTSKQGYLLKGSGHTVTTASKGSKAPKVREKGEFSQSSKSSIGEFSTSTSVSDDSNVSGSSCGNRPHMSKDFRWEAIKNVRKKHGILGLQHFNLLKKLGSGDIGTVYLAELIGTNCPFAIKVMDNEFLERRKKMPRARTEREILRMLDHPFLPTLYAQFTSGNLSCLVMEFCPGGDLHVLRQKQPGRCFPEQEARFYVAEVLLALEYLHMLGIVYRDLKPENILVREDGHIMLTDFDLSLRCSVNPTLLKSSSLGIEPPRISGPCAGSNCSDPFCAGPSCKVSCFTPRIFPASAARTRRLKAEQAAQARSLPQLVAEPTEARSNSFVGTHEYLAPEIIKGEGHGSAVDWWTLGIFLYELMFGKTPFRGPGNEETLANVVLQSLRFPNSPIISFQARDLIRGLLVKEPENRLGTETGAAEIKRHPFFDGLNWALIRCTIPPQIPELCDVRLPNVTMLQEKGKGFLECSATGEHLEFELF